MYKVKVKIERNDLENENIEHYCSQTPKEVFRRYISEGKLVIASDIIYSDARYITYIYDSKESRDNLKKEILKIADESVENDVTVTVIEEYQL